MMLASPLREKVEAIMEESDNEFSNENYEKSINLLQKAWDLLPEPKEIYDDSFYIAKDMIITYLFIQDYTNGKKWADLIFKCDLERIDDGERELLAGRVAYESGDIKAAESLFLTAHQKSEGRLFENKKYQKYLDLIKKPILRNMRKNEYN